MGTDDSQNGEHKPLTGIDHTTEHKIVVQYGAAEPSDDRRQSLQRRLSSSSVVESIRSSTRSLLEASHESLSRRCSVLDNIGTATIADEVFNLAKNIVGSAALAIPGGIAAFGNSPKAIFPAMVVIVLMGFINAYTFSLIGRVCIITGATSYGQAWELSVGKRGSKIVAFVCTFKPALGNLAYSMILADAFKPLLETLFGLHWSRTKVLWVITTLLIWPLCLLKNLKVLAPFSILGLIGMIFIMLSVCFRYFDGTYNESSPNERFINDIPPDYQPFFGNETHIRNVHVLTFICMLATAYVAHYNAPRFYMELKDNTIHRYNTVVGISYTASALFYLILGVLGFLTFGAHSSSFILNNYATTDTLATACRLGIIIAILFTYPIVFVGVRDGILDLVRFPEASKTALNLNMISTLVLTILTVLAASFTDLGIVLSFGGATLATAVIYIFPVLMFWFAIGSEATVQQKKELPLALALMTFGTVIGAIGATLAVTGKGE